MLNTLQVAWAENRRVLRNFFSLSLVQFTNYLAPLITLPYLFRVLGPSKYGLVELARAITVYFLMLTDYSFSLSATREISVHRDDPSKVSAVFSTVLVLRLLLVLLSAAALSILVGAVPRLRAEWAVYFLSFGHVIGMWLFPIWLFQGLERMTPVAVLSMAAKLLVIIAIFLCIRRESDYLYLPLLQSAGHILVGLAGLILAVRRLGVRFRMPSVTALAAEFRSGWHLFLSRMATTLYTTTNVVILGLLTDNVFVGYYAAGDKLVRAVQSLQLPLSQAIFPHIGRLAARSRQAALAFTARVTGLVSIVTLAASAALLAGAPFIARVALGPRSGAAVPVIRILSLLPLLGGLTNMFGTQIMVNFGLQRVLARILVAAGILNAVLAVFLAVPLKHVGVALAALTTEVLVTATMFAALRQYGLNVFGALKKNVHSGEAVL